MAQSSVILTPVQRFLLHTAVLPRLNAQICAALMEDAASQDMLEWLERNNLFVVPLDEQRRWYRVHDLFREVLLARLHATEPQRVADLHQRAAHWYAEQNELREAITHALAAADFAFAAEWMERAAPAMWLRGEAQVVQTWIAAMPDAVLRQHLRLALDAGLHLMDSAHATVREVFAKAQAQAEHTIARVEALLRSDPERTQEIPNSEGALLRRRSRLLQVFIAALATLGRIDVEHMRRLNGEAEALAAHEEDVSWKLLALSISFWLVESYQRQGALLIPRLLEAKQQALLAGDALETARVMRLLAFAYLRAGRLHLVHDECLEALALMERTGEHTSHVGYLHFFLSGAQYSWNSLGEAAREVQDVLRIADTWQHADLLIAGYAFSAELSLATGDMTAAEQALQRAEALIQQERYAIHAGAVVATRVRYWLATGDVVAASAWAEQVVFTPETWHANRSAEFLLLVRVYLAQRRYDRALAALERFSAELDRPGDIDTTILFLVLHAVALQGAGQGAQARAVTVRLLTLTEPDGHVRVYLDAGEPMRQVLQSLAVPRDRQAGLPTAADAFVARLLAAFEQEAAHGEQAGQHPSHVLAEPLTPREKEVLRLLVAGASNQEIAAKLVISLATVKKHVGNIFGKLGVQTRIQAITLTRNWPGLN